MALGIAPPMAPPIAAPIGAASGPKNTPAIAPPVTAPIPLPRLFIFWSGLCERIPLTISMPAEAIIHILPKNVAPLASLLPNLAKKPPAPFRPPSSAVPVKAPIRLETTPRVRFLPLPMCIANFLAQPIPAVEPAFSAASLPYLNKAENFTLPRLLTNLLLVDRTKRSPARSPKFAKVCVQLVGLTADLILPPNPLRCLNKCKWKP